GVIETAAGKSFEIYAQQNTGNYICRGGSTTSFHTVNNSGTISIEPGAFASLLSTSVSPGGVFQILGGGTLESAGASLNLGTVLVDGQWNFSGGSQSVGPIDGGGAINQTKGAVTVQHLRLGSLAMFLSDANDVDTLTLRAGGGSPGTSVLKSVPSING